jgi:thymidylate kinase
MDEIHTQAQSGGKNDILIGVVGVCASGKSTLIEGLTTKGYQARHIAQEHSYVKDMWKRITNPDLLIFLDTDFETATRRRKMNWTLDDFIEQQRRLSHARTNASLYIDTSTISTNEVLDTALRFLSEYLSKKE